MKTKKKPLRKRSQTDGLSKAELALMARLLEEAADEFGNHGCNDYTVEATDANKDIMKQVVSEAAGLTEPDLRDSIEEIDESKDEIMTFDSLLYGYFADRCKKLAEKK